jgi:hypothetical protein
MWVMPCFFLEHLIVKIVILGAVFACGFTFAATAQSASDFYPSIPAAQSAYRAYLETKDCAGAEFLELLDILDARLSFAKSNLVTDRMGATSDGIQALHQAGLAMVSIGDLAASKDCARESQLLYVAVIETFIDVEFAALRERAMVGIADLRAKT